MRRLKGNESRVSCGMEVKPYDDSKRAISKNTV